jgi:hypothetical protein
MKQPRINVYIDDLVRLSSEVEAMLATDTDVDSRWHLSMARAKHFIDREIGRREQRCIEAHAGHPIINARP